MKKLVDQVEALLYDGDSAGSFVYAVVDGAAVPELRTEIWEHRVAYECLFRGELKPDMAEVAPYLVRLVRGHGFTHWLIESGWGKHWNIFVLSRASLPELRRHFRTFFLVHDSNGKPLYFRYYDPRVLRVFLPTCNPEQLQSMFGPVTTYITEDEKPDGALRFRLNGDALQRDRQPIQPES